MASVPGFLTKTFEIFSSPEYSDCCGWGSNGETIIIRKIEAFSKNVLPKFFKHSNFQSFVRQLNMYDFHKTVQDPNHGEFTHEYFKQGRPDLLVNIKRKANKPPEAASAPPGGKGGKGKNVGKNSGNNAVPVPVAPVVTGPPQTGPSTRGQQMAQNYPTHQTFVTNNPALGNTGNVNGGSSSGNAGSVNAPPLHAPPLRTIEEEYYIDEDATHHPHAPYYNETYKDPYDYAPNMSGTMLPGDLMQESDAVKNELLYQRQLRENFERRMESKLTNLQVENNMLKRMFMESHHKNAVMQERMERVMKTLYTMFMGGNRGNMPGMALTNKAPSMLLTDMEHFDAQTQGQGQELTQLQQSRYAGGSGVSRPISYGAASQGSTGSNASNVLYEVGDNLGGRESSPEQLGGDSGNTYSGDLMRMDSASLERLPSLDLDELESMGTNQQSYGNTGGASNGYTHTDYIPSSYSNSYGNSVGQMLRSRALAGAPLSAANSFDLAASTVTAPSLQHQSSFDSAYLPIPAPSPPTAEKPRFGAPAGRVLLQATPNGTSTTIAPGNSGVGVGSAGSGSSADLGGLGGLGGAVLTGITGVPLSRQKTFDYTAGGSISSAVDAGSSSSAIKRKGTNSEEESPSKRSKVDADDNDHELRGLEHEDVNSSLQEAQQFMDLLNRNQQTTLTRLDSLEQTIASLFEGSSSASSDEHAGAHAGDMGGVNGSNSSIGGQDNSSKGNGEGI